MANLQKKIDKLNREISSQLPKETLSAFADSITDLKKEGIEGNCISKGTKIPRFALKSTNGTFVSSDDLLANYDKIIIVFFRGIWCPYCNLELKALQDSLSKVEKSNVKLVAVSPQKAKYSSSMKEKNAITFDILVDENNTFAKQLGISFYLQEFVVPHYQQLGIDLKEFNGNDENGLPIPAVYVFDKDYNVTYSFTDVNYMNRVNIDELIMNL